MASVPDVEVDAGAAVLVHAEDPTQVNTPPGMGTMVKEVIQLSVSKSLEVSREGSDVPFQQAKQTPRGPLREFLSEVRTMVVSSVRQAWLPMLISLAVGLTLIGLYYGGGAKTRPAFDALEQLKEDSGSVFAIVSTSIFGGLLPSLLLLVTRQLPRPFWAHAAFSCLQWCWLGFVVDKLYELQSVMFGDEAVAATVVCKVLFDQFVYNPVLGVPMVTVSYSWRSHNFPLRSWREAFNLRKLALLYCGNLISTWASWIPATSIIYSFPSALQIPAFNAVLFSFSVVLSLLSQRASKKETSLATGEAGLTKDKTVELEPENQI